MSEVQELDKKLDEILDLDDEPIVYKQATKYTIQYRQKEINVEVSNVGGKNITITPSQKGPFSPKQVFIFDKSKPNVIKAIGKMLIKASEL